MKAMSLTGHGWPEMSRYGDASDPNVSIAHIHGGGLRDWRRREMKDMETGSSCLGAETRDRFR